MKASEIENLFERFEQIVCTYQDVECWSARELYKLLGYTQWRNFENAVEKAKESCVNAGGDTEYHFAEVSKTIEMPKGAQKMIGDMYLTRYACYLIAQNGDPRKQEIAFAQNYFAVQTRRAELVQKRMLDFERVKARNKLAETEKILSGVLYERGVDDKGFAVIRSKGDKALFGIDTKLLKKRIGAPDNRPVADFLSTIGIKAKDLAAEMTSVNVKTNNLKGQNPIEKEHVDNNSAVRKMLLQRGIAPEKLPAGEDVKKVERRLKTDEKKISTK